MVPSRRSLLLGSAAALLTAQDSRPLDKPIEVRCGGLSFLFDPAIGFVRHVKWNGIEVLNGIYAVVRDENWGTVPTRISNVIVESEADAFKVSFEAVCKQGPIEYWWNGSIVGAPRALTFELDGEAKSTFKKNRLGFCVLHPMAECSGKPVKIDHVDGKVERGEFPRLVSPQQPFKDIKTITHEIYPGLNAEVRFAGDSFEMEDHRNWTDNNFKTYCTPLGNPFPVEVKQGEKLVQSVALRLAGTPKPLPAAWSKPTKIHVGRGDGIGFSKLPSIGFGLSAAEGLNAARLQALNPAHIRADLFVDKLDSTLDRAAACLRPLPGVGLEAALFLTAKDEPSGAAELAAFARGIAARRLPVMRYMVFHRDEVSTSRRWIDLARKHLAKGPPIGAGTNQFFAELNRNRPDPAAVDFVTYSVNPQVHAFDDMSILENAFGQGSTVQTARGFAGGKPVVVSPVTLKPRGTAADPRQNSLIAAAWTVASLKSLSGASSVTYFETHGASGLMDRDTLFPVYHVFASLTGYSQIEVGYYDGAPDVATLLVGNGRLILANLTNEVRLVDFRGLRFAAPVRAQIMDSETRGALEDSWELRGSRQEIALMPYAVAVLTA